MLNYIDTNSTAVVSCFEKNFDKMIIDGSMDTKKSFITLVDIVYNEAIINVENPINIYIRNTIKSRIPVDFDKLSVYLIKLMRESFEIKGSMLSSKSAQKQDFYTVLKIESLGKVDQDAEGLFPILTFIIDFDSTQISMFINYLDEGDLISSIGGTFGFIMLFGEILNSQVSSILYVVF